MEFHEGVHAYLAARYYVRLTEAFGERGRLAFAHATRYYAEQRGRRMAQRAIRDGVGRLDWETYLQYGEWENTEEARARGLANVKEVLSLSPDFVVRITACPWHAQFADMGLEEAGREYCRDLDRSIARGFNPELTFELGTTLHDGPCCMQTMGGANFTERTDARRRPGALRGFDYHCGHLYWSYREIAAAIFGEEGERVAERVLEDFTAAYGRGPADRLEAFRGTDFNVCG